MGGRAKTCHYCGDSFRIESGKTGQKYCRRQCGSKATYKRQYRNNENKLWEHEKSVFETAMEMHWSGEESGAISRKLNIPVGTMYSWIHDFGRQRKRKESLKKRLHMAKTSEEWLKALREATAGEVYGDMPIHLVCGVFHGQSVGKFTSIIFERLNENPLSGNVYAFCNKTRTAITTFAWTPPVFNIAKHIKMHGTFIWPGEELGRTIEVAKPEFERLLFLSKQEIIAEKIAKNFDIKQV